MQKGPSLTIRFGSKSELERLRKAARIEDRSLNSFIVRQLAAAANVALLKQQNQAAPAVNQ